MPNQFNGQVFDSNGNKLEKVKVTITGTGIPSSQTTETDSQGKWLITLRADVKSEDVTVTFSKSGLETTFIKNPQPTAVLPGYIDPIKGGTLDLAGQYDPGKWKISSLPTEEQLVLDQEIQDLYNFVKNNPGNFKLTIEASESKIPNADNEEGKTRDLEFKSKPGSLAKARAVNLQEYVTKKINELYFKEINPSFKLPIVELGVIDNVGGPNYPGKSIEEYKPFQYTRLIAELKRPRCEYVLENSPSIRGTKIFTKLPGITKITLDAADNPDRFGIEFGNKGKLNDYYSQTLNPEGSLITWEYIMYIGNEFGKAKGMTPIPIDKNILKTSLLADYSIKIIQDNIKKYAGEKIYKGPVPIDINKLIDDIINYTGAYGYEVRREETVFLLTDIPDNSQFTIKATNGSYTGGSAYQYKLCD